MKKIYWPYLVPFLAFLVFTYAGPLFPPYGVYLCYPLKTIVVAGILYYYRKAYVEITRRFSGWALLAGVLVFVVWVLPERLGWNPQILPSEFDPYRFGQGGLAYVVIAFRLIGAVVVVPIFEELFWRSFALRWLIDENFTSVPIGQFTWFSCVAIVLGFGFEHQQWFTGLLAGIAYNALLYYRKNLSDCIVAHALTNLLLGIYVLLTQKWFFW